jgi:hypothetical protein
MRHGRTLAMVWGSEEPAFSIGYEEEKLGPADSGFTVLFEDAPDPEDSYPGHPAIEFVCLRCLLDSNPELGRGLDIARGYGVADLDENGDWVVGDLSRLESG